MIGNWYSKFQRLIAVLLAFVASLTSLPCFETCLYDDDNDYERPGLLAEIEPFDESENDIRVMSFNIYYKGFGDGEWYDRAGIVVREIIHAHPDSIGLQEATSAWMDALKLLLVEYACVGVGRDDGMASGEHSAIFYLKAKYRIIDSGNFWLSETPDEPSLGWDANNKRICTWVILENRRTGERYMHINSHFDHIGSQARANSVRMILELASRYNDTLPIVFTADMNIGEGSSLYREMTDSAILRDTKFLATDTMDYKTFHSFSEAANSGSILDYVLVNDKFTPGVYRVITAGVDGKYTSDHFPIYSDLRFIIPHNDEKPMGIC